MLPAVERRDREKTASRDTSRSYGRFLAENLLNPINVVLFAIAIVLAALDLVANAAMTAGLVLVNVVVGSFKAACAKSKSQTEPSDSLPLY